MKRIVPLLFILIGFSSCQKLVLTYYGVKKPQVESSGNIWQKSHKYGLDTSLILTVKAPYFLQTLSKQPLPGILIFNKKGEAIRYKNSDSGCNAGLASFIPQLKPGETYPADSSRPLLPVLLSRYETFQGANIQADSTADFHLIIYYALWLGKLNRQKAALWQNLARENQQAKIQVHLVNLDLLDQWPTPEREKILARLTKK